MHRPLSIWIVPPAEVRAGLDGLVARHGEGPAFTPHVTLLGDLRVDRAATVAAAGAVVERFLPLSIRFEGIDTGSSFFRSVFLRVHASAELVGAHRALCEALGVAPAAPFEPHLSLAYGRVPETDRAALEEEVDRRGIVGTSFAAGTLTLAHAASTMPIEDWTEIETIGAS
jgi:2'-5' RNA ligase